jgi:hypothetical protein
MCAAHPYGRGVAPEHGQATIEWTGLVLLAAVAFTALAALRPHVDGRALGGSVAHAITCAARGGCDLDRQALRRQRGSPPSPSGRPQALLPPAGSRSGRPRAPVPADRTAAASRALRRVRSVAQKAWIVCLGYRRFVYERSRPRLPTETMPVDEALDIANECLNPLGFLTGD